MTLAQSRSLVLDRWARNSFWEGAAAKAIVISLFSWMMRLMAEDTSLAAAFPIPSRLGRIFNSRERLIDGWLLFIFPPNDTPFPYLVIILESELLGLLPS